LLLDVSRSRHLAEIDGLGMTRVRMSFASASTGRSAEVKQPASSSVALLYIV
jgi:hypothetical protein